MPSLTLLFGGALHFREHAGNGTIRQSLMVHFQNAVDDLLLAFICLNTNEKLKIQKAVSKKTIAFLKQALSL